MGTYESKGRALEDEFLSIAQSLDGDIAGREAGARYLLGTNATYHGHPLTWDMMPKIFDEKAVAYLADAAETMGRIMVKATRHYLATPELFARFGFSDNLARMVLAPTAYEQIFPLARVDIFLNEETGDFKFCEVNTDGSAGMTTSQEIPRAIAKSETYRLFAERHPHIRTFDLIGACSQALLDTYATWQPPAGMNPPKTPAIVVVDYRESASIEEVNDFIAYFATRGIEARFTDIRDLHLRSVDGETRLCDEQGPIWCVWRRAVTSEIDEKPCEGAEALISAVEWNLACVLGGFRTWLCATKTFFALLHDASAADYLDTDELAFVKAHVPFTCILDKDSDLSDFNEKDRWIVKPAGGYNSVGVMAGKDCTDEEWSQALAEIAAQHGIVQEYAPQYATPTMRADMDGTFDPHEYPEANNMEGLFLFNGKFGGVFPRCGYGNIIGEFQGRINQGAIVVEE